MFHYVLRVFHDVLLVVHDVLRRFTMFYKCFNFHDVLLCLVSRATIGITASATARMPIALGIGDNSAEIGDDAAGPPINNNIYYYLLAMTLRVPINNNIYEQKIPLFVFLAKDTFTNHHGVI